jgi:acyl-CoA reductase-like NAD-dependent aldehyde dehydrogenase
MHDEATARIRLRSRLIDGEIVKASHSVTLPSINPATEQAIGEIPATPEDVDRAVRSARHASTELSETS